MTRTVRRDASKRDRAIRRARDGAMLASLVAQQAGRRDYERVRGLEARYDARAAAYRHLPRGRRG